MEPLQRAHGCASNSELPYCSYLEESEAGTVEVLKQTESLVGVGVLVVGILQHIRRYLHTNTLYKSMSMESS